MNVDEITIMHLAGGTRAEQDRRKMADGCNGGGIEGVFAERPGYGGFDLADAAGTQ